MGADQIAAIRPAIRELEAAEHAADAGTPAGFSARFGRPGVDEPWVEVYLERETVVNFWYPFDAEPLAQWRRVGIEEPTGIRVLEMHSPACTVAFRRTTSREVSEFVDALFLRLYGCGSDYEIDVDLCRFRR
jgi:hypothetical protein